MGLTIYYGGRFKEDAVLLEMIEEVVDIAEVNEWNYTVFEREFDPLISGNKISNKNIYGICFSPPNCEPVCLTFECTGKMCSPFSINDKYCSQEEQEGLYSMSTKTQYAGFEVHAIIIRLFKHLSEKYLENFVLHDESQFWEDDNELKSKEIFERYDNLMNSFEISLKEIKMKENETLEESIRRISDQIKSRKDKK